MATKVKELTLEQLKVLVEEVVQEKLEQMLGDPDKGLEVKPELLRELKASLAATRRGKRGTPLEQLASEIGLDLA
jgi:signal recognition particle GTPase